MPKAKSKAFSESSVEYIVRDPILKASAKCIDRMPFLIAFGRMLLNFFNKKYNKNTKFSKIQKNIKFLKHTTFF